jgi:hypothetical protein
MTKQFLIFAGLSLLSMTAFSQQQISNSKKLVQPQVPVEASTSQEQVSDSIAVNSMNKQVNPGSPVDPKEKQGSNTPEKPALNSINRKPE